MRTPRKELGQNFLINKKIIEEIIRISQPAMSDTYLEIGPGEGAVTEILAQKVGQIMAVELDRSLAERLTKSFAGLKNVKVINEDILSYLDICYHDTYHDIKFNKVIGSIPYQITSPLLHQLADLITRIKIDSITLLVQEEVTKKINAKAPRANYLSNFIQTFFEVRYITAVPKECFSPIPKVDGAIVKLQPKTTDYQLLTTNSKEWSAFLHQGFKFPRKMLKKVFNGKILQEADINPSQRPQEISLENWLKLYRICSR